MSIYSEIPRGYKMQVVEGLSPIYDPHNIRRVRNTTKRTKLRILNALREHRAFYEGYSSNDKFLDFVDPELVEDERDDLRDRVRDYGGPDGPERRLATLLNGCSGKWACGSAACPVCSSWVRGMLCEEVEKTLPNDERWSVLHFLSPVGSYTEFVTDDEIRAGHWHAEQMLKAAQVDAAIGWVGAYKYRLQNDDVDWECCHTSVALIVPSKDVNRMKEALPTRFRIKKVTKAVGYSEPTYSLQTWSTEWKRDPEILWRIFEPRPFKLISSGPEEYLGLGPHEQVRQGVLTRIEAVHLASAFHGAGWGARLILRGLKLRRGDDGICLAPVNEAAAGLLKIPLEDNR